MATGADIRAALGEQMSASTTPQPRPAPQASTKARPSAPTIKPRRFKKPPLRARVRSAHWTFEASPTYSRQDQLAFRRWNREAPPGSASQTSDRFAKYNVAPDVPTYDPETYEKELADPAWTKEETDYLMETYRECNGKWPVVADRYISTNQRSMEDLKARFYHISAKTLSIQTPISSMTGPEYNLYEMLKAFDPHKEASRKKLAEGHLSRPRDEVDEETVLLGELQRIMLHQSTLDAEREDLRRRLHHPQADSSSYQYSTSTALTALWQQLLAADRARKVQRLRPAEVQPRPSQAQAAAPPPAASEQNDTPSELSKADLARFGVVLAQEKLPTGISFASDRLSKPRVAKSTAQTDKIATILQHIGVPELIPLPTIPVIEQFEAIMSKVHALLDMRKLAEKEEQELRVRQAEVTQ